MISRRSRRRAPDARAFVHLPGPAVPAAGPAGWLGGGGSSSKAIAQPDRRRGRTLLPAAVGVRILAGMTFIPTTIAGIPIPDSSLAREATEFVQDESTQLLFDHSRRV